MARLACPPTFSRLACGTAKPAARRVPIQPAASRTTLSISAATRTTNVRNAPAAAQVARSAGVSAVVPRMTEGACLRALREVAVVRKKVAESGQMKVKTQIPGPKMKNAAITKWARSRRYKAVVWKTAAGNKEEINDASKFAEEAKTVAVVQIQDKKMEYEESEVGTFIDNNPELLNDVSFDANLDTDQQSSKNSQAARFDELFDTHFAGGRVAPCPVYGDGDSFILGRKRPKVVEVELKSDIPRFERSTLKYGVVKHDTTTVESAELDATKTFNCFGFGMKLHAHSDAGSSSLNALEVALFFPDPAAVVQPEPVPVRKTVRFDIGPVKPRLFDPEAPPRAAKTSLSINRGLQPLETDYAYLGSSIARGFKTMFQFTSLETITLKRRVLQRFKAVQGYELRRNEDAIAAGNYSPPLGQLDYGNTDYKLALQLNKRITVDDIGMWVDPNELSIPASTYNLLNGPLLHFGGFEDKHGRIFENAYIPDMAAAYKEPISWNDAPESAEALHQWTYDNFATMQPASFEDQKRKLRACRQEKGRYE